MLKTVIVRGGGGSGGGGCGCIGCVDEEGISLDFSQ